MHEIFLIFLPATTYLWTFDSAPFLLTYVMSTRRMDKLREKPAGEEIRHIKEANRLSFIKQVHCPRQCKCQGEQGQMDEIDSGLPLREPCRVAGQSPMAEP